MGRVQTFFPVWIASALLAIFCSVLIVFPLYSHRKLCVTARIVSSSR
jgi:hypothetical protein